MRRLKLIGIAGAIAIIIGLCEIKSGFGQENQPAPKATQKQTREAKKKEWLRQRKAARTKDSALKAHMKHQTKEVRKRMKKDAKKAKDYNNEGLN